MSEPSDWEPQVDRGEAAKLAARWGWLVRRVREERAQLLQMRRPDRGALLGPGTPRQVDHSLSSVTDHALGHTWLGLVDILTKRAAEGIAECEHALALDRNLTMPMSRSDLARFSSVAPKKPRLTLPRTCVSVRAIRWLTRG